MMVAIPVLVLLLGAVWMQLVQGQGKTGMDFQEAYTVRQAFIQPAFSLLIYSGFIQLYVTLILSA